MRFLAFTSLMLVVGCAGGHSSTSTSKPDHGSAGEAGAGANAGGNGGEGAGQTVGGGSEAGGEGGASGGAVFDGGSAGEAGAGDELLPDEPDNGTRSGTRLKAEWYDFDGTRVFADFYDTDLKAPCEPGPWSDGKTYCIPVSTTTLGYTTNMCNDGDMLGYISFNQACARPSPGYLVLPTDSSPCGTASAHVYRLAATPTSLTQYFASQNGGCSGPFSTGYNSDTYPVTGEVMVSELVEFTREALADPGKLSRQYLVTADGARLAISPHDRELDADCTLKSSADYSGGWCAPTNTRDASYYGDMDCK